MNKLVFASVTWLAVGSTPAIATTIDEVFAFGDSLNDCCINPMAPFTNGSQTWLVEFASLIGATYADVIEPGTIKYNYATGGAQSGEFNAIAPGGAPQPNGLLSQIVQFKADAPVIGADDLAVIWVGTNDIWASSYESDTLFGLPGFDIVKPLGTNPETQELADYVAGNIQSAVVDLRDLGFGSVLLLTPYDIGDSALFDVAGGPAQNTEYSEALLKTMFTLFTPGIDTYVLDVVGLIRQLQAGSPDNGFTELGTSPACNDDPIICEDRPQSEQDSFIFYDFVHLTTATNSRVAAAAADVVKAGAPIAPIPLPASLWFMVPAMGGLALLGRVRRRGA